MTRIPALVAMLLAAASLSCSRDPAPTEEEASGETSAPPVAEPAPSASAVEPRATETSGAPRTGSGKVLGVDQLLTLPRKTEEQMRQPNLLAPSGRAAPVGGVESKSGTRIHGSVDAETSGSTIPGRGYETRDVRGRMTVEPGGTSTGQPKVSVEVGTRERSRAGDYEGDAERQTTGGIGVEIPLPK